MNTHDPFNEREWQAQERASQDERAGATTPDPLAARYRLIARALQQPMSVELPSDFAERLGAQVAQGGGEGQLERILILVLLVLMAGSAMIVAAWYGETWLQAILAVLPSSSIALQWGAALAVCVGANWLWEQARRHLQTAMPTTAS